MADYFAALAARTLRPELSVQPRQHVRWEEAAEPYDRRLSTQWKKGLAMVRGWACRTKENPPRTLAPQVDGANQVRRERAG
jgi:hypothetical protein